MFNARSETAAKKPTFHQALQKRCCVLPADGFYEWQKHKDESKRPYYIGLKKVAPFWFARINEEATDKCVVLAS